MAAAIARRRHGPSARPISRSHRQICASTRSPSTMTPMPIWLRWRPSAHSGRIFARPARTTSSRFSIRICQPAFQRRDRGLCQRLHRADARRSHARRAPQFLKVAYNGPAAMEELAAYDPSLVVGILGGGSGTLRDTFELVRQAKNTVPGWRFSAARSILPSISHRW